MMLRTVISGVLAAVFVIAVPGAQDFQPTCRNCPATYIPNAELQAYITRSKTRGILDQQVRALDIGKINAAVGIVHRDKLASQAPDSVAEHDLVSEVYYIIDGAGTLVTGSDLVDKKRRSADAENVRMLNGPGNGAAAIRNGVTHELKTGDVIVIPAGTGHVFSRIDDHITYLMMRLDPDKVTPLKTEADSRADLARDISKP
jgi:mannose-6-phosphate isomerase-like protein (cupin superfamily)